MGRRRLLVEWIVLCGALSAWAVWGAFGPDPHGAAARIDRIDTLVYDRLSRLIALDPDPGLVIVEIDEDSIAQVGRWPWPRPVQAALVQRLARAGIGVLGFDVLLTEPGAGDESLEAAFAQLSASAGYVLPVGAQVDGRGVVLPLYPLPAFGKGATLGHAHFVPDADGQVRSVHLREAGLPALALAMREAQGAPPGLGPVGPRSADDRAVAAGAWPVEQRRLLPAMAAPPLRVAASALLRGEVPEGRLGGKAILVGVTAGGLGDRHPSALLGGVSDAALPGVHLHAVMHTALARERLVRRAAPEWAALVGIGIVLAVMLSLLRWSAGAGVLATVLWGLAGLGLTSGLLLRGIWIPPGGWLLAIALAPALWSWRRLAAAVAALRAQAERLEDTPAWLLPPHRVLGRPFEPVTRDLIHLEQATQRALELQRLLSDVLDRLPHPTILADEAGGVLLRNRPWVQRWGRWPSGIDARAGGPRAPFASIEDLTRPGHRESQDRDGADWLIDCAPLAVAQDGRTLGLRLVQLVDISSLRAAERERDQMVRFLSHDLRAPGAAIVSIAQDRLARSPADEAMAAILRHAHYSLSVASGFVQLSRAELRPLVLGEVDLCELAQQVVDMAWSPEKGDRFGLEVAASVPAGGAVVRADAELLRRALSNLIDNALRHGPAAGRVTVAVEAGPGSRWRLSVEDEGQPLEASVRERVFEPFWRSSAAPPGGSGLGLAFVQVVAQRHHATAYCTPAPDGRTGNRFGIEFPAPATSNDGAS